MTATIRIPASYIAGCIGRNPYVPIAESVCRIMKLNHPDEYHSIRDQTKRAFGPTIGSVVYGIMLNNSAAISKALEDVGRAEELAEIIKNELKGRDAVEVQRAMRLARQRIFLRRGIRDEHKGIDAERLIRSVQAGNNKRFSWRPNEEFMITGKVDGYAEDNALVEIKARQERLFRHVPDYEWVQCQTYMILADWEKVYFREFLGKEHWSGVVMKDPNFGQQLVGALPEFKVEYFKYMTDKSKWKEMWLYI